MTAFNYMTAYQLFFPKNCCFSECWRWMCSGVCS